MKILVTGFDPFGGESTNPSWEAVKRLPEEINGVEIIKLEIPTEFYGCMEPLIEKIESIKPDAVLSVGQAGGRSEITPEFIGINVANARIPDNAGEEPYDIINEFGPDGIFTNLPIDMMVERMKKEEIPARISYTAGTFVCNYVLYSTLEYIKSHNLEIISGFIHVPYLPSQVLNKPVGTPYMTLEMIVKGLELSIEEIIERLNIKVEKIEEFELNMIVEGLKKQLSSDM